MTIKQSPAGHRRSKGAGRIQDACPGCCVGPEGKVKGTAAFTADWDAATRTTPVWSCNNCGHQMPRRHRRSKGALARARMIALRARTA
tara:strand:+ start:405 stop:668 length:264 start_codon:yes stop_codon:yes gene_type:complete